TGGLEGATIQENHVVVETVQRRLHALAVASPPVARFAGEKRLPRCAPDAVGQRSPLGRNLGALDDRLFVLVRLDGDRLIQTETAGAIRATGEDDRLAGDDLPQRRFERRGRFDVCASGVRLAVGRDVVDMGGVLRYLVGLRYRPVGAAGRLRLERKRERKQ